MKNNSEFFELLLLNNKQKLEKWILKHGKSPKVICPVCFYDECNETQKEDECKKEE